MHSGKAGHLLLMRQVLLFLLLPAAFTASAQPAVKTLLPEVVVIPQSSDAYVWKKMLTDRSRILFNNAIACTGDEVFSFGGFNTLRVQREMNRILGRKLVHDSLRYPGAGFMNNLFFIRDSLLFIGGGEDSSASLYSYTDFWQYNRNTRAWKRLHDLPFVCHHPLSVFTESGQVIVLAAKLEGERPRRSVPTLYEYQPEADRWTEISGQWPAPKRLPASSSMFNVGLFPSAFLIGDDVFVFFQVWESGSNCFYKFNLATRTWTELPPFPGNTQKLTAAFAFSDGVYGYIGGGFGKMAGNNREVFRYDPEIQKWEQIKSLPLGLRRAKAWRFRGESYVGFGLTDKEDRIIIWKLQRGK